MHGKTPKQLLPSSFLLPHFLQSEVHPEKTVSRGGNASAVSQLKTSSSFGQGTERDQAAENCTTKRKPATCEYYILKKILHKKQKQKKRGGGVASTHLLQSNQDQKTKQDTVGQKSI